MKKKIPVGATIAHAYRFGFTHAADFFKATWLPLLAQLAVTLLLAGRMIPFMTAVQAHDPAAASLFGPMLLLFPLLMIFFVAQFAAAMETALDRPPQSWVAFHFNRTMWRLLGGLLFALLAVAAVIAVTFIVLVLAIAAVNFVLPKLPANSPAAALMVAASSIIFLCVVAFTFVRLVFLLPPVNVSEQRMGVRRAWKLSAGNFWRLFLVALAIAIPVTIVNYTYVFSLAGFPAVPPGAGADAVRAAETAWRLQQLKALVDHWYFTLPVTALLMLFQFSVGCSAQAFAYRKLTEDEGLVP